MPTQLIHYTDYSGVEPAIVLIHGFTCDVSDWDHQVKWCRDNGRRVITLDPRGHGQSNYFKSASNMTTMGSDVATLLQHLSVRSAIIVGHSMGTRVATEVALQIPDVIVGVALVDGSRKARGDPSEAIADFLAKIGQIGLADYTQIMFDSMFLPGEDEVQKKCTMERARARPSDIGMDAILSLLRWDAVDFDRCYGRLDVPVQVIQSSHKNNSGERIPITADMSIDWHREIEACGVNAEFEMVTECGHFTMLDAPDSVNASLERLLARIEEVERQLKRAEAVCAKYLSRTISGNCSISNALLL